MKIKPKYYFFIPFLWISFMGLGQTIKNDTLKIPDISIEAYTDNPDFNYVTLTQENVIAQFFNWLKNKIKYWLNKLISWLIGQKKAKTVVKWIIKSMPYVGIIIFVYLIFRFLLDVDLIRTKKANKPFKNKVYINEEERLIKDENIENLLEKTIKEKNYRLAVRYYYLLILKQLNESGLIHWQSEKTNRDYIKEIKNKSIKDIFKKLTFIYEYTWYGKYPLSKNDFEQIQNQFLRINKIT